MGINGERTSSIQIFRTLAVRLNILRLVNCIKWRELVNYLVLDVKHLIFGVYFRIAVILSLYFLLLGLFLLHFRRTIHCWMTRIGLFLLNYLISRSLSCGLPRFLLNILPAFMLIIFHLELFPLIDSFISTKRPRIVSLIVYLLGITIPFPASWLILLALWRRVYFPAFWAALCHRHRWRFVSNWMIFWVWFFGW